MLIEKQIARRRRNVLPVKSVLLLKPQRKSPMQYVVTGASGFVGTHLLMSFDLRNKKAMAISRQAHSQNSEGLIWMLRNEALAARFARKPETTLFHLEVKQHIPNPTPRDIEEFHKVNVAGTQDWLDWCTRYGIQRFILFSTIKAVQTDTKDPMGSAISENAPGPGDTPYGNSKWQAELAVRRWAEADARRCALILRPAVIYGPGNRANIFSFVDALSRGRFFLVGRNENIKSIVSIQNLCAAVEHLLNRMRPGVEIYNITDEYSYSVRELAEAIARLANVRWTGRSIPLPIAYVGAAVGSIVHSLTGRNMPLTKPRLEALLETTHFSCAKLLSTGFKHPQTTDEGLTEMIQWHQNAR